MWLQRTESEVRAAMTDTGVVVFKAIQVGIRPDVRASAGGITYERRYANWLTWTLVIFTCGIAAFAWPWILFGRRSVTIPRNNIQSVDVNRGVSWATLRVNSTTDTVAFRTDVATAEQARNVLLGGAALT